MSRTKLQQLIDQLEHRIERASRSYHNIQDWCQDASEGDTFVGSYNDWIDEAFLDLRREALKLNT